MPIPRLLACVCALVVFVVVAGTGPARGEPDPSTPALRTPFALVEDRDVGDRLAQPEDRHALAGGCYTIEATGAGFVARDGQRLALTPDPAGAEPFHFQPTRLGHYLIATNEGRDTGHEGQPTGSYSVTGSPGLWPATATSSRALKALPSS